MELIFNHPYSVPLDIVSFNFNSCLHEAKRRESETTNYIPTHVSNTNEIDYLEQGIKWFYEENSIYLISSNHSHNAHRMHEQSKRIV